MLLLHWMLGCTTQKPLQDRGRSSFSCQEWWLLTAHTWAPSQLALLWSKLPSWTDTSSLWSTTANDWLMRGRKSPFASSRTNRKGHLISPHTVSCLWLHHSSTSPWGQFYFLHLVTNVVLDSTLTLTLCIAISGLSVFSGEPTSGNSRYNLRLYSLF